MNYMFDGKMFDEVMFNEFFIVVVFDFSNGGLIVVKNMLVIIKVEMGEDLQMVLVVDYVNVFYGFKSFDMFICLVGNGL